MAKKKSKGVLERIGEVVTTGAEAAMEAGAKAVGGRLPKAKAAPKRAKAVKTKSQGTKASPKAKAKAKGSQPKAAAKTAKGTSASPKAKAAKSKVAKTATTKTGAKKKAATGKKK